MKTIAFFLLLVPSIVYGRLYGPIDSSMDDEARGLELEDLQSSPRFGGRGGRAFGRIDLKEGSTIQLRTGSRVDALILDGQRKGGTGGKPTGVLTLGADEYINAIEVRSGSNVDFLRFRTNKGQVVGGGGGGGKYRQLTTIRVIGIEGRSARRLDAIKIYYVKEDVEGPIEIRVISYNMAGGARRVSDEPLLDKTTSFDVFATEMENLYKAEPTVEWIFAMQEISRTDTDKLRNQLMERTGITWYKNSVTQRVCGLFGCWHLTTVGLVDEAVATFSTSPIIEVKRQYHRGTSTVGKLERGTLITRIDIPGTDLWVFNTHPDSKSASNRKNAVDQMRGEIAGGLDRLDQGIPVIVAGDMNIEDPDPRLGAGAGEQQEFLETMQLFIDDGYTRGENFIPSQEVGTFKPWSEVKNIIDYVLMDEKNGACTMYDSTTLTFKKDDAHASDHHGVMTKIRCG